jgi:glycosyltransferase involved in cell wall biosynthesis
MKKNLLFLGHLPPPNHGAAIVGQMVLSFVSKHYCVKTIKISTAKNISDIGKGNIIYHGYSLLCILFNTLSYLMKERPVIVYITPSLSGKAFYRDIILLFIMNIYHKLTNARVISHLHMRPTYLLKNKWLNNIWNMLSRNLEVILLSPNLLYDFSSDFQPKKIFYAPNSVNRMVGDYLPQIKNTVLYIGHILSSKGAFRLLQEVNSFNDSVTFIFAGEFGSDKDKKKFYKLMGDLPKGKVKYLGVVSGQDKSDLFAKATVLAIPSFSEALPLTMIEAFSCGLPVVGTNVGGLPDYITNETGVVCDFIDFPNGLKKVIQYGRSHYSSACQKIYNSTFTKESFEENLNIIFEVTND